ncbi:extracellular solute-binding protein [Cohnella zeiphila]|uniref:Extracellular solute-binding protein n=1 Tax=Cohnella zeiphila TaxID=2761120 RepID=A0A7X0VY05_9BACL|nr:extracellular solute-binding protein [Cohnella zeiphila]MBB6734511.1 extracellular solute-binding protein [Cohnella zeiphila]
MKRRKSKAILSVLIGLPLVLSACGGNQEESAGNTPSSASASQGGEEGSPSPSGTAQADPFGKYDPAVSITAARPVGKPSEGDANNPYNRLFQQELGIKVAYDWTAPNNSYDQKLSVSMASGELPDLFWVNANQLAQLVEAGQVEDLSAVYDKYASPLTKKIMTEAANQLDSAKFDGKLYALPYTSSPYDQSQFMWIRTDWLKKLNLPEPKTMADVLQLSDAFTHNDPDGNGKNDTYGLAINKNLTTAFYTVITGLMNGYHAYPDIWIKDSSGKLAYGSIQPEVKQALAELQKLYQSGQIDKEFGVQDESKVIGSIDKFGILFGSLYAPVSGMNAVKDQHQDMDWQAYPVPSIDDDPAKVQTTLGVQSYYVVKKGYAHPEALIKLMNTHLEYDFGDGERADQYREKLKALSGGNEFVVDDNDAVVGGEPPTKNYDEYVAINQALQSNDPSKLGPSMKAPYDQVSAYLKGDTENLGLNWAFAKIFGPQSAESVEGHYLDQQLFIPDAFYGAPTPTMRDKMAALNKMEVETFTKIIMGAASADEFDKFVEDWKKLGGEQITKEVNDWAASR